MAMAGHGKRFQNSKFNTPKALIKINKKPMFIQASKSMPKSKYNIFICHKNLASKYNLKQILKNEFSSNFTLITVKKVPQGQAKTCLLASKYLREDDRIFVHSCDNLINFNHQILISSLKKFNGVIITTKPNKSHINNISMYGWVNIKNRIIKKITCKTKASNNPKHDFVITGSFAFQNKKIFVDLIKNLVKKKMKINNEYYLDMVFSNALIKKYKIKNLIVKSYYNCGTPKELINWEKKINEVFKK